jgi:4'-phosphopantetheinyl transferase EntD
MSTYTRSPDESCIRSTALTPLFPQAVLVVERRSPGDPADLMPSESHYLARASRKRIQEFAAGRACARGALAEFGVTGVPLNVAVDRQPLWPAGFVGSITHTTGFCAAAVARAGQIRAIGLDSEVVGSPTPDLWPTICRDEELAWVSKLPIAEQLAAVTLVFSAKEAFYKCQYPLVAEWLDFHDLSVSVPNWNAAAQEFMVRSIRVLRFAGHAVLPIMGRYVFHQEWVSCGVYVPAA